jgi:hypothetical protein
MPGHMAGGAAQGANLVRGALEQLQKALSMIPLGGDMHQAVIKAVSDLSKHVGEVAGAGDPQAVIQQLAALARAKQQSAVPPALAGGGAPPPGGPMPGGPPPMPGGPPPMPGGPPPMGA